MVCRHVALAALVVAAVSLPSARADINGFGNLSGFTVNQPDSGPAPSFQSGVLQLATSADAETRSIFYSTAQDITQFTASFTYRADNNPSNAGATADAWRRVCLVPALVKTVCADTALRENQ